MRSFVTDGTIDDMAVLNSVPAALISVYWEQHTQELERLLLGRRGFSELRERGTGCGSDVMRQRWRQRVPSAATRVSKLWMGKPSGVTRTALCG